MSSTNWHYGLIPIRTTDWHYTLALQTGITHWEHRLRISDEVKASEEIHRRFTSRVVVSVDGVAAGKNGSMEVWKGMKDGRQEG